MDGEKSQSVDRICLDLARMVMGFSDAYDMRRTARLSSIETTRQQPSETTPVHSRTSEEG
ncbi:Hypothetical protein D9617_2g052480 [Elsinoe fawcettii]|nr:Hypothetical protein D9617_2g052480 [Elsinoe fawcettii]